MTKISNYVRPGSMPINAPWTPGSTAAVSPLEVKELDGAPDVTGVKIIRVPNGTLTDEGSGTVQLGFGPGVNIEGAGSLEIVIDGGGAEITTGIKAYVEVPFDCTLTAARLAADQPGSIVVDIWQDTYGAFPPVDADSITAGTPPTLVAVQTSEDTTLSGWTTALVKGDWLAFNVDSATTVTRVTVSLTFRRAWVDVAASPLNTKGDLWTFDTDDTRLGVSGVDGRVLSENSATATGLEWIDAPAGASAYEDLIDVDMTGITDGQIPIWDAYASLWLPGDAAGVADILDLPTAETDTSLRLAPDGAGGVEFVAGGGGPSDYVSGASGTGQLVIPGIAVPDRVPGSPNAADDEFDAALSGSWTTYGSPGTSDANAAGYESHYHLKKVSAAANGVYGIYRASITIPFTVTVKLTDMLWRGSYPNAMLGLGDAAAPTTLWGFGPNPYYTGMEIAKYTLPSTRTSSAGGGDALYFGPGPLYLRLVVNSTSNVDCYVSKNGLVYYTRWTAQNPGLTVGTVWIFQAGADGSAPTLESAWDWIRFT